MEPADNAAAGRKSLSFKNVLWQKRSTDFRRSMKSFRKLKINNRLAKSDDP